MQRIFSFRQQINCSTDEDHITLQLSNNFLNIFNTSVAPSEALFLFALWFQGLTLLLATKFYAKSSLHFGQDLLIGNGLALLVLGHDLWLFTNLCSQILLGHFLGLSPLSNKLSDTFVHGLMFKLLSLGIKLCSVKTGSTLSVATSSILLLRADIS